MQKTIAPVISNREVAPGIFRMEIASTAVASEARAGQFVHLRCSDGPRPFFRRPFGIHRVTTKEIAILYKVVGEGTALLSKKCPGMPIDLIGPLGAGFDLARFARVPGASAVIVAGGMGVAPLFALAETVAAKEGGRCYALLGACSRKHLLCRKEFAELGAKVRVSTDDGSCGAKGLVTDLLRRTLRELHEKGRPAVVFACGPHPMLKAVAALARAFKVPCQVSLEEKMACGVGVCLGCPVKMKNGPAVYKMVCKDGPVFDARDIAWN